MNHYTMNNMAEIQLVHRSPPPVRNISLEIQTEDIASKLAQERMKNEEIRKQLTLEKARADRLQKKVQFIQDNQDLFNQLKEAYSTLKLNKTNTKKVEHSEVQVERDIQDGESQTTAIEVIKTSQVAAVNKRDLAEVAQLIQELKQTITKGGQRVCIALESDKQRDEENRKRVETENIQLKRELYHKSSELDRLRSSTGSGPREVTLLRRILAKMLNAGTDLSCLSSRESSLARYIAKKYGPKVSEESSQGQKMLGSSMDDHEDERFICITQFESTAPSLENPSTRSPRTPHSPLSPEYSTPRWNRAEDVP